MATVVSQRRMTLRGSSAQTAHAKAPVLPTYSTSEPVVRMSSSMPPGYNFVAKGNPYLTRNCRQQAQQAHQVIYVVIDDKKKQVGIRVPSSIYHAVSLSESRTRSDRRLMVQKNDESLEKRFREAILARFPRIPLEELPEIVRRATAKGSGRVGRTGKLGMAEKAHLAVQAHVRHNKTDYDSLLRRGSSREEARLCITRDALDILTEWGPPKPKRERSVETTKEQANTAPTQEVKHEAASLAGAVPPETMTKSEKRKRDASERRRQRLTEKRQRRRQKRKQRFAAKDETGLRRSPRRRSQI